MQKAKQRVTNTQNTSGYGTSTANIISQPAGKIWYLVISCNLWLPLALQVVKPQLTTILAEISTPSLLHQLLLAALSKVREKCTTASFPALFLHFVYFSWQRSQRDWREELSSLQSSRSYCWTWGQFDPFIKQTLVGKCQLMADQQGSAIPRQFR